MTSGGDGDCCGSVLLFAPVITGMDSFHLGSVKQAGVELHSVGVYGTLVNRSCCYFDLEATQSLFQGVPQVSVPAGLSVGSAGRLDCATPALCNSGMTGGQELWSLAHLPCTSPADGVLENVEPNVPKPSGPNSLEREHCFRILACTHQCGVTRHLA